MNKVYNVIWSSALNALVVVAEGTKSRSKSTVRGLRVLVAFLLLAPASGMSATLPQGGMISIGEGTIVNSGTGQMTIKQSTDKLGINWQSFNVGADGKVIFDQPNKNSVALNRVIGSDASTILGRIEANGQVFLINPNGVIFGKDSKVNVGGLVASTLDISDEDFKNGNYHFSAGASNGEIINNGTLQAAEGGYVAVLGKSVKNNGLIKAQLGTAALAAGDAVTLDFSGDGLINVQVDKSAVNALAENKGLIKADGGNVLMTARASNALLNTVVNNEGVIEAQTIGARGGKIFLDGGTDSGTVLVAGTLDASAPVSGDGGFIETSGAHVKIANGTKVTTLSKEGTTGDWLVDPTDFNIVSGNAAQTSSQIGATTLQDNLALTNVTLQTAASGTENGDINVNADVTWSANTTLTLDAHGDINFNENVNVLGATGGLDLKYGSNGTVAGKMVKIAKNKKVNLTGAGTTYSENGKSYIVIRTAADLALFNGPNGNLNYVLGSDIDASVTSTWNAGLGYAPGGRADTFVGALQGLNHKISDLYINRPTADYVGLFGYSNGAKYSNLSITGNVTGKSYTGLLAGQATDGSIYNVDVSGTVVGKSGSVGGLAGSISREDISYVNSNVVVTGAGSAVGGLIGELNTSTLSQAFSKGSVNNTAIWTGGLIGILRASTLDSIYSTSSVEGTDRTGGLVGAELSANTISNAYSTGTVIGRNYVGGFAGSSADGILSNVFTTSDVTGNDQVGGFVGYLYNSKVNFAYSTGTVVGATNTGGFGGLTSGADSEISYTYTTSDVAATSWAHSSGNGVRLENYYINTSLGMQSPGMSQGITKAQLQSAATFTNWDISNVGGDGKRWRVYEGQSGPLLRSFMTSAILGGGATADYKGSVLADGDVTANFTFDSTLSNSIFQSNGDFAYELTSGGSAIRNAGTYALDAFYSTQFGYDIAVPVPVNLVVNKAHLTIGANASSKNYDGNTSAVVSLTDDRIGSDDLVISAGSKNFSDKNAGTGKTVTVGGITVTGADAMNYTWDASVVTSADIAKANLTISANGGNKTYNGSTDANVSLTDNRFGLDDLVVGSVSSSFADKNAGTGKTITVNGITVTGADAGNYTWNTSVLTTADITKAALNIAASGVNKTYDGSATADANLSDNRIGADDLVIGSAGKAFADKNAGNGKVITVSGITVTGADSGNYSWNTSAVTTADIAKAALSITADAASKVYDGTTNAGITLNFDNVLGDDLSVSALSQAFDNKNAGTNKAVTVGLSLSGADADNYVWNTSTVAYADITKASLSISAVASDKTYDGTSSAGVTLSDDRIAGDDLILSAGASTFTDKNAGSGKLVIASGLNVTGADANNYTWNTSASDVADIAKADLAITAAGINKTYDTTASANATLSDSRVLGDDLTVSMSGASFSDKNAGNGKTVTVNGITVTGADADNYTWSNTASTTADIAKANLTISAIANDKVYDATTNAETTISDNRLGSDDLVITKTGSSFDDKNAGLNKTVTVEFTVGGADAGNYDWNTIATDTASVSKAQLNITAGAASKDYDATTDATVFFADDRIAGDSLTVGKTQAYFDNKNAGMNKTVTVDGITLTGADADNYVWNASGTTTADIGRAVLIINATGVNKTYDGTTDASSVFSDNRIGADDLIVTADSISFVDKNADTGKQISISGINISGADANNYIWDATAVTTANITKANLDVSAIASGKTYDGNTSVSTTLSDNRISGDSLVITSSNAFADKNAGANKTVNIDSINVTGADAQNYTWNTSATTTADISKAQLDITIGAAGKDYDATTNADVFLSDNRVSGDSLAFTHDQAFFDNKNAGTGKLVTVEDIGLIGADAGNYTWNTTATTTADIGRAVLSINANGVNKTYDGTTDASSTFTDNRLGSDDLSISADSISFIDKNAEFGKQISISGINVTGADAGNYIWDTTGIATADISKATLNVTATAGGKTYDGTTGVSTTLADNRLGSDDLVITSNSAFADKNAGLGKTVNIDSINVTGADAGNYVWNTDTTTNADISKAQLVVTVDAASKDYDSTVHADAFLSDNRIAGDSLVLNYGSASFSDKNAGSGKTVTADGITVTGLDAGNYEWNTSGVTTADIGRAVLTIDATGVNKTYDANTSATVNFTDNRLGSDSLIISADESTFIDKNAEAGKQISISGITVTGADAGNYIWDTTGVATADIAKANLSVTATAGDKTYDGTTGVSTTLSDNRFGSDDLVISSNAAFTDKNAGVGKTVNVNDIIVTGADAQNYTWNATTSTTANIGKATLQIDASATDKIYDGSNAAQSNLTDNRILGDNLVISSTNSTFADKNAADGKLVTVSGINVTGVDAANYEWNTVASTTADIGKATLVIGAAAQNKTYDGSTSASVTLSDNRVGADDLVISSSGSTFADKNAGVGKNVSVSGLNVTGADAQNYTWNTTASSTATIAKANLVVSATASDKVYNGSSAADTTLSDNRIGSDDLILSSGSSTFSDKNAGSNKTVTVSGITVTGADAQNYNLNTIATTTADIAKAQLDVTAGAASKDYDSTRNANVVLSDNRISGDNLILSSGQALFDTKDAGLGKNVAIDGINVTGADAANYTWNVTTSATADIGKAILSITAAGVNKTYDGTVNGNVVLSDNRLGSDSLIIGASDVQFIDKNAATGKQMSVSGITVTGADAGNYIWDGSVVATADINKAVLNVSASAQGKTYDGTTSVTSSLSDNRFGSDDLNITGNAAFADKNAGNNKLVTVDGISVTGADANNYTWNVDTTTTANIAKAVLNITTGAVSRDYDSTTNATAVLSDDRIAGDSLVLSHGQAKFDDKNAGMGKTVTVNDITVTGADAGNYVWNTTGTTTADIGRAVLTINTTGVNKTYDGTTDASTTFTDNRFAGDTLTIDAGEAKFIDKNAENGKQISISGINVSGADASNYIWDATAVATADITKAALNVSGLASNKVYDGNTSVSTSLVDNRILGDDLTVSNTTSAFADKNAGNGKAVIIGGITVSGADASNYTWNTDAATTANISKATLVIDATSGNKTYDSTTSATATLSDNRISGDDLSLSYSGAAFADKNAGVGKLVTVNGISVSGADAGNYTWNTSDTTSANIAKAALTVTATGNNKVYDGTTSGSVVLSDSRFANDDLSLTASAAFSDKNAGSGKALLVNGINVTGADASNYTWNTTAATSADIAKAVLNIGASAHNKVYDTTTGAVIDLTDNRISGDQLTIAGSGAFQDKNAGAGKNVNVSGISVTGTDAGNYTWNSTASASADISKANLVVSAIAGDKTYDGTTAASSSLSDNRLGSDNLVIASSGANFTDKNAGAGKSVTVNGITVSGSDAANYNWNTTAATTATINKAILTITGSAQDKTYDGSRNASTTLSDNRIGSDDLNISAASSLFADKNAGTGKVVSIDGIAVAGSDAGNYTWNVSTSAVADIAKANLNVVAVAQDKTYDGSNSATIGLSDNRVMGDDLVLNTSSAQFSDKNAGAGKVVTVGGLTLSGADATNYNVSSTVTTTATINKATLSVSSVASDKTYDGSTAASAVLSDNRIAGDSLSLSYGSAAFADKNAGNNKSVGVSGISVSGADAGNYVWNTTSTAVADIAKANLTITASGANKVYDGSTAANVSLNDNRVAGDQLNLSAGTSQFSDKNAGAGKAITVGGITVTGADAANYNWNISTAASADITKRALAISANASDKTYDGNNSASASLNDNRVLGDNLVITSAGSTFADKNAGANKQVTVSGISVTGTDADNYTFGNQATGTATINKAVLNIGAIANDKVYDATTGATASLTDNRILGDSLVVSASGTAFADKNAGANKAVNVSGITVSGADANNYTWNASTSSTANIAKAVLNVTADVQDKVYDGSTLAQTSFNDNRLGSDSLTIGSVSTSFSDKNAGVDKVVTINGITVSGADAANYTWNASTTGLADINKANLAITATGQNKVYDTTTAANVTLSDNRVVGDNLVIGNSSAAFTDKNAGAGKVITVGGITVSGADAGNYVWSGSTTATADIAKAQLTVTATANDKVYNGSTAAQTTLSDNRLAGDVLTANAGSSTFADKNAGSNKVVTVGGITLSGQDAANYEVNSVAVATATIDKASLTIGASASDKVYDGTTNANVSLTDNRVAGDKLTVSSGAAAFTDKNAGANKDVGVSGITVGGDDSINYTWNTSAIAKAAIEKARLTISGVIQDKVYDGTTSANLSGLTDNRIAGDDLSISATGAAFANKNAGANKVVNINGVDVQGADSGNYEWSSIATSAAEITKAFLSLAASGSNKVYDGTAAAGVSITDNRVSGDSFTVTVGSAAFDNKNAGQAKTITAKDIALTGEDAGNYTFANTLTTQADVQKADLGVSAGQQSKVHGKADPALSWKIDQGTLFAGDTMTGSLGRAAGEELGSYAIDQGTLSAGDNYNLTFKPGSLEIVDAPAIAPGEIDAIVSTVSKGVLNGALPVRGLKAGTPEYRLLNLGMKLPDEEASTGEQFAGQLSDQDEVEILN